MAKVTNHYMVYEIEGDSFIDFFETAAELFHKVSYIYAFSDCEGGLTEIKKIVSNNCQCFYDGWMPCMEYRFHNEIGEIVWDAFYPGWDH